MLLGGRSGERPISLLSGARVLEALRGAGVEAEGFDPAQRPLEELRGFGRAFIALHGSLGEDGAIQGVLEWMGIPYTGSGVAASALAMDKWRSKLIWGAAGLPTPRFERVLPGADCAGLAARLGLPLMVKPAREGSSLGISKVKGEQDLPAALREALAHDEVVIAEQFIAGPEVTVGILGEEALPLIRLETPREFYDYEAKYLANDTRYLIPSGLPAATEARVQRLALEAFAALGCRGWGRVDFMLDRDLEPYLLELNTVPGMTDHSLVPMAARAVGLDFGQLSLRILEQARVG